MSMHVCVRIKLHTERCYFCLGAMDTFARGLRNAARILEEGILGVAVKVSPLLRSVCSHFNYMYL